MKKINALSLLLALLFFASCTQQNYKTVQKTDTNGYSYETVSNDPAKTRIYTLDNGLKVYLSVNKEEPRIQTLIGVRAGSTSDPVETTGLAHYFEHMMFKGTNHIGTTNWEAEKALLDQISDLFEQRRATDDTEQKDALYKKIDSLSYLAAGYVATNEYDKLASALGAKGTNAGTSYDMTVYINNIPSNELEKWIMLESERFGEVVLRLFHTELETVYEEYNMYEDMDRSRANKAMMHGLFAKHPYGRDVIGLAEHIKNPSMVNIYNFYDTFYVPNNMAVILVGDFDYEETIKMIDEQFGNKESKELPEINKPAEDPITEPIVKEVYGPDAEFMSMAYRFETTPENEKYLALIDQLLSNSKAGLIDLDLNQKQKVLRAGSYSNFLNDYGMHVFYGSPRQGQSLEEVKELLLAEIEKIKKGEFEDWMLDAVINDFKLSEIKQMEENGSRAFSLLSEFIKGDTHQQSLAFTDELKSITKEELVAFANEHYNDNYVVVYKKFGEKTNVKKVEKPAITAVPINRELQSDFYKELTSKESAEIKPVFVDFQEEIYHKELQPGLDFYYLQNETNELFSLNYIIDMGKNNMKMLPIAVNYLPYLGTDKYSPSELQQEFFKLGLSMNVNTGSERSYVSISGLESSMENAIELLEHVLNNAKADGEAYNEYVKGILKQRQDAKKNNSRILWGGMFNYGKYGPESPFTDIVSEDELINTDPESLTAMLKDFCTFEHKIFYYGQKSSQEVEKIIGMHHKLPEILTPCTEPKKFEELEAQGNKVYFTDYDMTQANILFLARGQQFDKKLIPPARLFGEYFGGGLSSIVFQEIRESRALAYSAFASYSIAGKPERHNFTYAFVGTQADKLKTATDAMLDLMNEMPQAQKQFDLAKESIIKNINTERIIKENIFWTYLGNMDKGINYDIRKEVYEKVDAMSMDDLNAFFNEHIKGKKYTFMVLGSKENVDMKVLGKLGSVEELTLENLFNY